LATSANRANSPVKASETAPAAGVPSGRAGWHGGEIGRGLRDPRLVIALEIWIRPRRIARNPLVRHIFLDNQTIGAD
jgi:hypothetical protein